MIKKHRTGHVVLSLLDSDIIVIQLGDYRNRVLARHDSSRKLPVGVFLTGDLTRNGSTQIRIRNRAYNWETHEITIKRRYFNEPKQLL